MTERPVQILVTEDEEILRDILVDTLSAQGYVVHAATTGADTLRLIDEHAHTLDAILLDRLLPDMDSLTLLPQIKAVSALAHVPVIIQTSLTAAEDVAAGLNAGAYYYLTKPFPPETLLTIVRAALRDRRDYLELQDRLRLNEDSFHYLERGEFRFRTPDEARKIAIVAAYAAPDPSRVVLGLTELMLNAVEHGNLAISYDEKSRLIAADALHQEIEHRLADPRFADRSVRLFLEQTSSCIAFTIRDEGLGFEWQSYLEISPERAFDTHGRGIAMSRLLSFDRMEYRGGGNEVVCTVSRT
jgi:DNA-binding response OmpR family regulator